MKAKRGISPIIATVILIAVTIAIGIAIAGWLMGLWGGMGGAESLKIYPNATLTGTELKLTVKNEGSRDAKIIEVRVDGVGRCTFNEFVKTGEMKTLSCQPGTATPGASYVVRVMTEAGNVYSTHVTASSG